MKYCCGLMILALLVARHPSAAPRKLLKSVAASHVEPINLDGAISAYLKLSIECNWSLLSLKDEAKAMGMSVMKPPNTAPPSLVGVRKSIWPITTLLES